MLVFFIVPIGIFFIYSFWTVRQWDIVREWNLNNYIDIFSSPVYTKLMLRSLTVGLQTALLSVLVVYPLAYTMVFRFEKYRDLILFLLAISLFSNYLIRIYAWRSILSSNGLVNWLLMSVGLADGPESYLLFSPAGVVLVLLNVYLPFATLPIYSALLNVERDLIQAAADLGAGPLRAFFEVTLPLSMPGVVVSFVFIFLLSAGDFITPELVGGKDGMMIGNAVATQFGALSNWPLGSAMVFSTVALFLVGFLALFLIKRAIQLLKKPVL
jgi:spermidine/putrescine transport system permease protein